MQHDAPPAPRSSKRLVWMLIAVLVVAWLMLWQWDALSGFFSASAPAPSVSEQAAAAQSGQSVPPASRSAPSADAVLEVLEGRWFEVLGSEPLWPADFSSPADCDQVEQDLLSLCRGLDAQVSLRGRLQGGGTCALVRQVADLLAASLPQAGSELRSLDAVTANVFHLFRVLGSRRVELLRDVLAEDEALVEPVALTLYRWSISREDCASTAQPSGIRLPSLYGYSGFLLQTIGGQAYLRRRSPHVEALASFYALMLLERAVEQDHNPLGIDPRRELRRCRRLIASQKLVFGDRYLERLDAMSRRWQGRG